MKSGYTVMLLVAVSMTSSWARDEIVLSKLDRSKSKEQRAAFSDWVTGSEWEIFYEEQKQKGQYLLYVEGNGKGEYRGIFGKVKPNGWYVTHASSERSFLDYHLQYKARGLNLMTLSKSRSDTYGAVWVHKRSYDAVSAQLAQFGISLASVSTE